MMDNYCHTDIQKLPSCIHGLVDYCKICDGIRDNKPSKFVVDAVNAHNIRIIDELPIFKAGDIITYTTNGIIKMREFDLQKALAGEKLITRNGLKVTEFHHFKTTSSMDNCLIAVINGGYQSYNNKGRFLNFNDSPMDLFMAPTTKTYYVNVYKDEVKRKRMSVRDIHESLIEARAASEEDLITTIEFTVEE